MPGKKRQERARGDEATRFGKGHQGNRPKFNESTSRNGFNEGNNMGTGSPGNGGTPSAAGEAAREAPSDRGKRPTPGGTGADSAAEKPVHWTETRNLVCEACEKRPNASVAFSCYSCNLVLCTKCAVAGRHIRCAGCGTVAKSRRAQWSIWAPRAAGGGASALHGTAWLVCCCCADKENSDGAGRARFAAHGDLKDLCAWCTECAERGGSADLQHTRVEAAAAAANREDDLKSCLSPAGLASGWRTKQMEYLARLYDVNEWKWGGKKEEDRRCATRCSSSPRSCSRTSSCASDARARAHTMHPCRRHSFATAAAGG